MFRGGSDQVVRLFVNYSWPGNVCELKIIFERGFFLFKSDTIITGYISLQLEKLVSIDAASETLECAASREQILMHLKKQDLPGLLYIKS